ncbi:hypothetical protein BGZ80_003361 [Entomortierella chlamydospora]|uniref:NET domain-containing protein n=1 Tax=Entomortierella chlamydospora TaxID=101097 RepID=A0A9P6MNY3_9FUNG|nr:hypothetical protein BGZ79_007629 [Entomortierella chlamydospora]KAG0008505.1 hypothetical protein BGZ80_003361 [Entomortierella chlamydospora]
MSVSAQTNSSVAPTFSISDFLVPALQTKVWEDWQSADDFTTFDPQTFSSDVSVLPFQLDLEGFIGNSSIWENDAIPEEQAYDELVFDLAPTAFDVPATVNVADLIVGPNSMASSAAVSPLDLAMSNDSTYQDLALANLYGFNDASEAFDSESDSDSEDEDSEEDDDQNEDEVKLDLQEIAKVAQEVVEEPTVVAVEPPSMAAESMGTITVEVVSEEDAVVMSSTKPEDPNKRRMEEVLATRINNDLGPEHMAGLFKILKGTSADQENEDEDEEMEVDLSSLDEATLVEVYQYVESCCMQTMGFIIAAEQRERAAELERQMLQRAYAERTPELSPSHSCASSNPPSPPHPSSHPPSPSKSHRSSHGSHKKRHGAIPYATMANFEMGDHLEQDSLWTSTASHPYKSSGRRKRSNTGTRTKMQKDVQYQHQQLQGYATGEAVVLRAADDSDQSNEMEYGEDAEIDIVGI